MVDGYHTIGEAATLTGLSVKAIRHYATEGLVCPSAYSEAGYRLYATEDLWRLSLVRLLRDLDLGLPRIQQILLQSSEAAAVLDWHKQLVDQELERLGRLRNRLQAIPATSDPVISLTHLHMWLEAINMSNQEKQAWLENRWSQTMISPEAPQDWKSAFLSQLRDALPSEWTGEQTEAWVELQAFLDNPTHQDRLQDSVRPFWEMMQNHPGNPNTWTTQMEDLVNRAREASTQGAGPDSPLIQTIVDDWIQLFADTMRLSNTQAFVERFFEYAQQSEVAPSQTLWDLMMRLNPKALVPQYNAQKLMMQGLRWKMSQLPQGS